MATTEEGTLAPPPRGPPPAVGDPASLLFPDHTTKVSEERFHDERFDRGGFLRRRSVAVDAATDAVIGELSFNHMPWAFHPHRVAPRGGPAPPAAGGCRGRKAAAAAWPARRGFRDLHRSWESRLDVAAFDPARFAEEAEVPPGIKVVTLADELKEDPERLRQVAGGG